MRGQDTSADSSCLALPLLLSQIQGERHEFRFIKGQGCNRYWWWNLIGAAVAKTLINDGAKVMIVEINADSGAAAANACGATFFHGDITDDTSITKMVDSAISSWGRVDILVNLACSYDDSGADSTRTQWTNTLNVNISSAAMLAGAVRPYMAKQGGGLCMRRWRSRELYGADEHGKQPHARFSLYYYSTLRLCYGQSN